MDLKTWNQAQVSLLRSLGIPLEPGMVAAFGKWFFQEVDRLHRFPRPAEARRALTRFT